MLPENFHLDKRYYYSRLNENEKAFYVFMLENLLQNKRKMVYAFDSLFVDEVDKSLPSFKKQPDDEFLDLMKVYDAVIWDSPELFYLQHLNLLYNANGTITIGDDRLPFYSEREIAEINAALDEIYHRFDGITDEFELERAVHDFITESYDYDERFPVEGLAEHPEWLDSLEYHEIFTVAGPIKTGKAVCGGLIRIAQFVLQRRGLTVANIISEPGDEPGDCSHSWLGIRLGDSWYHLDITFNESSTKDKDCPQYMYFNVTDEEISEDHDFDKEKYPDIVASSTEYNYYRKTGLYFTRPEQATDGFSAFMESIRGKVGAHYYYFRMPRDTDVAAAYKALQLATRGKGMKMKDRHFGIVNCDGYFAVEVELLGQ